MKLRDILKEINIETPGSGPSLPNKFTKNVWDKGEQEYFFDLDFKAIKKYLKSHWPDEYIYWGDENWDRILEDHYLDLYYLVDIENNNDVEISIDHTLRFYLADY